MSNHFLFLLSAIGGLNGLFLSIYFAFFTKQRGASTYFLAALIATVSVRITKSAFLHFNDQSTFVWFIQIGIIACALIGPFLYLYVREATAKKSISKYNWLLHTLPVIVLLVVLFNIQPYQRPSAFWGSVIGWGIYTQWLIYVLISFYLIKNIIKKLFNKSQKLTNTELWLFNLVVGVAIIWLAYRTSRFTSYIVGALSFSFIFYISILLWLLKRKQSILFFETTQKYASKKIEEPEAESLLNKLKSVMKEKELYKNPNVKLKHLSNELGVSTHHLSQLLNDNLGKSFSIYINSLRIEEAKKLLQKNNQFTLEAIGLEAGFSSKSTFYATFKKLVGCTPAEFKKQYL